ncbi:MAG: hypothetical protein OEM62_07825, partial [Acidobacteriota bacterium]|nr:hypothetical protein [Acidobacteriota bacterium]
MRLARPHSLALVLLLLSLPFSLRAGAQDLPIPEMLVEANRALDSAELDSAEKLFLSVLSRSDTPVEEAEARLGLSRLFDLRGDPVAA